MAAKTDLCFESLMPVEMDTVAETQTHENLRPRLGPLSQLSYKLAEWRYRVKLSATPTTGNVTIKLVNGTTVIRSESFSLNGISEFSNRVNVDVSPVTGEAELSVLVDVTASADAGTTATVDSVLSVDVPMTVIGC